jgi:RNA polymerase-binding protein DksA
VSAKKVAKLTKVELGKYREVLLQERRKIVSSVTQMEDEALKATDQDFSVDHMADYGTDNYEQELTLGLLEGEARKLKAIDRALKRIREGGFGTCEACEKAIRKVRLKALPFAELCIDCQRLEENGELERPDA